MVGYYPISDRYFKPCRWFCKECGTIVKHLSEVFKTFLLRTLIPVMKTFFYQLAYMNCNSIVSVGFSFSFGQHEIDTSAQQPSTSSFFSQKSDMYVIAMCALVGIGFLTTAVGLLLKWTLKNRKGMLQCLSDGRFL